MYKKLLLAVLALIVTIACFTTPLFAQETPAPSSPPAAENPETAIPLNLGRAQTDASPTTDGTGAAPALSPGVSAWPVVRTFLAILLVVGALWLFNMWVKKRGLPPAEDNPYLRRLFSLPLGANKSAQVITLGTDRAYLIGVADNGVNLIAEITDKELLSTLTLYAEEHSAETPKTFAALLALFTRRAPGTATKTETNRGTAVKPEATKTGFAQTETYLRSQLDQLRRGPPDA